MSEDKGQSITLKVLPVEEEESSNAGIARLTPGDLEQLGAGMGEFIAIRGKRQTVARISRTFVRDTRQGILEMDALMQLNGQVSVNDTVEVQKIECPTAKRVVVNPVTSLKSAGQPNVQELCLLFAGRVVLSGDRLRAPSNLHKSRDFIITETEPDGGVVIGPETTLVIKEPFNMEKGERGITYRDIGGLDRQIGQIREVIELPLKYPQIFKRLGIEPPKGVLLFGPPGCGKTLIARAVANETSANFLHISGPEIIHKYYGESEAHLREVFKEATEKAPSIIFFDEIDAIAPKREDVSGEVEKRVVAQLMALMDGLESRGQIVVIAATNIPDAVDSALRRPGRFDREVIISAPDKAGRRQILDIHTRNMPLAGDVELDYLAGITHGFVGADLASLCREAAMISLRRFLIGSNCQTQLPPEEVLSHLEVFRRDFTEALKEVRPAIGRGLFARGYDLSWNQIGGLDGIKKSLEEAILWPLKYAELFNYYKVAPPKGILLYGRSGTGKTMVARAIAGESGANFISIKGPALLSKWVGESEKSVRDLFQRAKLAAPSIILFDEIDALTPRRSSGSNDAMVTERVVSQLLSEIDNIGSYNVILLAATNRVDLIDPALLSPGRFELLLELQPPDRDGRLEIFKINLQDKPLAGDVNLDTLADLTEGMVGAQLASVCRRATMMALRDEVEKGGKKKALKYVEISARHFRKALAEIKKHRIQFNRGQQPG